ncbi:MAG: hypothetical protein ACLFPM_04955 [Candidatus Izemoplasmatales bacterium]
MILILAITVSVGSVFAWINFSLNLPPGNISVGELDFTTSGSFIESTIPIYPGKELINEAIVVTDQSTIDTQMRVMITYTKVEDDVVIENFFYTGDDNEHIEVNFNSPFVYGDDYYWYYPDQTSPLDVTTLPVIDSLFYDGHFVSNQYAEVLIRINVVIQVKQSDYVNWVELTNYNFVTGQPQE